MTVRTPPTAVVAPRDADRREHRGLLDLYAILVLVHAAGAFVPLLGDPDQVRPLVLLLWIAFYAVAAVGLADLVVRGRVSVRLPRSLLLFVGLALVSVAWSEAPALTGRRSFGLLGTALVALYLAQHVTPVRLLLSVRRAALIIALASLALFAIGEPLALDDLHGTLRGVLTTKNSLGRVLAIGILSTAVLAALRHDRARREVVVAVPMLIALGLTDSASGFVVTVVGLAVIGVLTAVTTRRGGLVLMLMASVLVGVVVFAVPSGTSAQDITALAGRDATLTGRTDIWSAGVAALRDQPVLGYGYGAFWEIGGNSVAEQIRMRLDYEVANAHNGLLDTGLGLGLLGMVTVLSILLVAAVGGVLDTRSGQTHRGVLRLFLVVLVVATTAVESGLLQENTLLTVAFVVALGMPRQP